MIFLRTLALLILTSLSVTAVQAQERNEETTHVIGIAKDINIAEFDEIIASKKTVIIDVRTPKEFKAGHVKDAVNINIYDKDFLAQVAKYNKSDCILLYCKVGGRSASAMSSLQKEGYQELYNLNGGYKAYSKKK